MTANKSNDETEELKDAVNVPMDWAFFIAFDTSFCFLPHKPEKTEGGVTQPDDDLIQMTCFGQRLTCDVAAIDPARVRRDELREQLQGDKLRLIHNWTETQSDLGSGDPVTHLEEQSCCFRCAPKRKGQRWRPDFW